MNELKIQTQPQRRKTTDDLSRRPSNILLAVFMSLLFFSGCINGISRVDVKITGEPTVGLYGANVFHGGAHMEFEVTNSSSHTVSDVYGHIQFITPGREVEYCGGDFSLEIPGGIAPGETLLLKPTIGSPVNITTDLLDVTEYPDATWQGYLTKVDTPDGTLTLARAIVEFTYIKPFQPAR